jgi:hypothetical protein
MSQQPKPSSQSIQEILKLIDALSSEEQMQLMEDLELRKKEDQYRGWLRAELKKGDDAIKAGDFVTLDEFKRDMAEKHPELRKFL